MGSLTAELTLGGFLLSLAALIYIPGTSAEQCTKWHDPELQKYQDEVKCFPDEETLYMLYRNYDQDPLFGGNVKCVYGYPIGEFENDSTRFAIKFGGQTLEGRLTLVKIGDGYTLKNAFQLQADGVNMTINILSAYANCKDCKIFNMAYLGETAYSYWVPESQLGKSTPCCEFVYDLLAGTSPKVEVYEEGCTKETE